MGYRTPTIILLKQQRNEIKWGPHLNHEHYDEHEDEGSVEVGDVEGGAKPTDESVSADHHGKKHCCQFWAEISHKAEKRESIILGLQHVCL